MMNSQISNWTLFPRPLSSFDKKAAQDFFFSEESHDNRLPYLDAKSRGHVRHDGRNQKFMLTKAARKGLFTDNLSSFSSASSFDNDNRLRER